MADGVTAPDRLGARGLIALVCGALWAGCATGSAQPAGGAGGAEPIASSGSASCGIHSLYLASELLDWPVSYGDLATMLQPADAPVSMLQLHDAAAGAGLDVEALAVDSQGSSVLRSVCIVWLPALAQLRTPEGHAAPVGHFEVVQPVGTDRLLVLDFPAAPVVVDRATWFARACANYGIDAVPVLQLRVPGADGPRSAPIAARSGSAPDGSPGGQQAEPGLRIEASAPADQRRIVLGPGSGALVEFALDFGSRLSGEWLSSTVTLRNDTGAPLRVGDPRATCGCTSALVSQSPIPVGGECALEVSMDLAGRVGRRIETVEIPVEFGSARALVIVQVSCFAEQQWYVEPTGVVFAGVRTDGAGSGADFERVARVTAAFPHEAAELGSVRSSHGAVSGELTPGPSEGEYALTVRVAPSRLGAEPVQAVLDVYGPGERAPEVSVPVSIAPAPPIRVSPQAVLLWPLDGSDTFGASGVRLESPGGGGLEFVGSAVVIGALDARVAAAEDAGGGILLDITCHGVSLGISCASIEVLVREGARGEPRRVLLPVVINRSR